MSEVLDDHNDTVLMAASARQLRRVSVLCSKGEVSEETKQLMRERIMMGQIEQVESELDAADSGDLTALRAVAEAAAAAAVHGRVRSKGMLRLSKNLASKISGSKNGRKVIHQYLGTDGTVIMDAIMRVVERISGSEKATALQTNIYTVAMKAATLANNNQLDDEKIRSCIMPIIGLIAGLADQCELSFCFNPQDLVDRGYVVGRGIEMVMFGHVSPKTMDKLRSVLDYFCTVDFFTALLKNSEHRDDVDAIDTALRSIQRSLTAAAEDPGRASSMSFTGRARLASSASGVSNDRGSGGGGGGGGAN